MKIIKTTFSLLFISTFLPSITSAAGITDLQSLIQDLIHIINLIVPLLFGIAVLAFMWGVIKYILAADPKKLVEARSYIIFSIIGIAVMMSVWALSSFVKNSFFPSAASPLSNSNSSVSGTDSSNSPQQDCVGNDGTWDPATNSCI